jgi:predicted transcriptional regulator
MELVMAAPTRTRAQREADLAEISRLYCTGWRQVDIADRLGIAQQQVSYDLKAIFADWRKQRDENITEWTNAELAKINALELEYWEAWRRSCEDRTRVVKGARVTPGKAGKQTATNATTMTETLLGNPARRRGRRHASSSGG